jgi:hypothetical protein
MTQQTLSLTKEDKELLNELQRGAFQYFMDKTNPANGLVADSTWENAPASIAAVGFGLAVYLVGVERNLISRPNAVERTLVTLRFLADSHQGPEAAATSAIARESLYHPSLYLNHGAAGPEWRCNPATAAPFCIVLPPRPTCDRQQLV